MNQMTYTRMFLMALFYEWKTGQMKMPIARRMVTGFSNNGILRLVKRK